MYVPRLIRMYLEVSELRKESFVECHLLVLHRNVEVLGHTVEVGEEDKFFLQVRAHSYHLLHVAQVLDKLLHICWSVRELV